MLQPRTMDSTLVHQRNNNWRQLVTAGDSWLQWAAKNRLVAASRSIQCAAGTLPTKLPYISHVSPGNSLVFTLWRPCAPTLPGAPSRRSTSGSVTHCTYMELPDMHAPALYLNLIGPSPSPSHTRARPSAIPSQYRHSISRSGANGVQHQGGQDQWYGALRTTILGRRCIEAGPLC